MVGVLKFANTVVRPQSRQKIACLKILLKSVYLDLVDFNGALAQYNFFLDLCQKGFPHRKRRGKTLAEKVKNSSISNKIMVHIKKPYFKKGAAGGLFEIPGS